MVDADRCTLVRLNVVPGRRRHRPAGSLVALNLEPWVNIFPPPKQPEAGQNTVTAIRPGRRGYCCHAPAASGGSVTRNTPGV
jgi:hypothetical protein